MNHKVRRIAVLFSRLSGYMAACLRELKESHHVDLVVYRRPPAANAPFSDKQFDWISSLHDGTTATAEDILKNLNAYQPDAVFMVGWADKKYLRVARQLRKKGVPVVAGSDAQWSGSLKQYIGVWSAPWYLHSAIDVLWVAGERQRQFARRLGFTGPRCWTGYYACDWKKFAPFAKGRDWEGEGSFLYVGRYEQVKGIDVLLDAYVKYRNSTRHPWPLACIGAGSLEGLLQVEGVENEGFIQPDALPERLSRAYTFILPSRKEPWGVVVQEAAAAGLPLICSDASGAAVHLLQDGYNGYFFENGNVSHLAGAMQRMSASEKDNLGSMSMRSYELSKQYTPDRWARTLVEGIQNLLRDRI